MEKNDSTKSFDLITSFRVVYFKKCGADPKVLNFNKIYMEIHRRSGLLISKYAL